APGADIDDVPAHSALVLLFVRQRGGRDRQRPKHAGGPGHLEDVTTSDLAVFHGSLPRWNTLDQSESARFNVGRTSRYVKFSAWSIVKSLRGAPGNGPCKVTVILSAKAADGLCRCARW